MNTVPASTVSTPLTRERPVKPASTLGNGLAILALLALAAALARWQVDAWTAPVLRASTVMGGATVIAAYAGFVRLMGRASRRSAGTTIQITNLPDDDDATWLVVYASQFGDAESIAQRTTLSLQKTGHPARLVDIADLDLATLQGARQALFIASTTGEGDAPDPAANFVRAYMTSGDGRLERLRYGILALGDSDYQQFCAFGHQIDHWLRSAGAQALFDLVEVDDGDPGALRHWQYLLGQFGGAVDQADWKQPAYRSWSIGSRQHVNAGSPGGPVFDLHLTPANPDDLHWQAGDIAEIGPCNAPAEVQAWLNACGLDGDVPVTRDDNDRPRSLPLCALLARSRLPCSSSLQGKGAQQVADELQPLPHRAYSIASIPAEGCIRLLVRQASNDEGVLGLGSGWLTAHADAPGTIDLRVRRNPTFHAPDDSRPLILIGNGTGVAGLRALLQERIEAGKYNNWLLYGERSSAHDFHYRDDIDAWHRAGGIERLDLAFSRDQPTTRYVQHLVEERADALRDWLNQGAAVYVCGSLKGMAPAVHAALASIAGAQLWNAMAADGRYRRDVY